MSERAAEKTAIEQLAELLGDVNARVQIGLRAQGKFDTVRQMLVDGCGVTEIGRAIGWDGKAALEWFAREAASELSSLPPVRGEQPMTQDSHGNNVDFLMSVNAVLNQQGAAFRIDTQNGQAIAVPVPECLSECSGVRGEQETATTANGSMPISYLECPCCGNVGARADLDGFFHDGDWLVCGCYGWVTADGETLYISGTGDEPCPKCEPSAPVRAEVAKTPVCTCRHDSGCSSMCDVCKAKDLAQLTSDFWHPQASASLVREAEPAQGSPLPLEHARACAALTDEACTCGLAWRVRLVTEQEMHAAWRKRAEEAESAGAREAEPLKALVKAFRTIDVLLLKYSHENSRITAGQTLLEIRHALNGVDLSAALEGAATKGGQ